MHISLIEGTWHGDFCKAGADIESEPADLPVGVRFQQTIRIDLSRFLPVSSPLILSLSLRKGADQINRPLASLISSFEEIKLRWYQKFGHKQAPPVPGNAMCSLLNSRQSA